MQLLLHHDSFHVDLRPSTSHVNSFHSCSVLPTSSPHAAATAVPLKSQRRSCHPAAQNPSALPALPTHSEQKYKSLQWWTRTPTPGPTLADRCPPRSLLPCRSGLLKPALDSPRCCVSRLEAPARALPSAWAFLESCGLALKSARDKSYT